MSWVQQKPDDRHRMTIGRICAFDVFIREERIAGKRAFSKVRLGIVWMADCMKIVVVARPNGVQVSRMIERNKQLSHFGIFRVGC